MALEAELETVHTLLGESAALREWWRGERFGRGQELAAMLRALEEARRPLTAYTRRMPVGHSNSTDPVYLLNREATAELRRLRMALRMRKGTPRPATDHTNATGMRASIGQAVHRREELAQEHAAMRARLATGTARTGRSGNVYRSTTELRQEADELLGRITRARDNMNRRWASYCRHCNARSVAAKVATRDDAETPGAVKDEREAMEKRVRAAREALRELRTEVEATARQRVPDPVNVDTEREGPWDLAAVIFAWSAWYGRHGEWPTKAHHNDPSTALPSYTLLRRIVGDSPRATVVSLMDQFPPMDSSHDYL